jgi:hypothetical protein
MFYVPNPQPAVSHLVMPPSLARPDPKPNGDGDDGAATDGWSMGGLVRLYMP